MRHKQARIGDFDRHSAAAKPKVPITSWWADHARPEQRATFMDAAKARHVERVRVEDLKEGKKNQAMRHVIDPRGFPPSTREKRSGR